MAAHLVEPGTVLADRYLIEDLLSEEGESYSWRARDQILSRTVVVHVLPSMSPHASELLDAAKRSARVADTRVLQVLDALSEGDVTYVVREWATGQSLDVVLDDGPLPARRAAWLVREVAAAIANAHEAGVTHGRLAPDTVVVTSTGGIKLIGLGTFAALRATAVEDEDPHTEDTRDLGRLLYACLTARWPDRDHCGLPAAPTERGRLLRPRQVRAGVPHSLDAVCDRILGDPPRQGQPLTTPAEVKDALDWVLADDGPNNTNGADLQAGLQGEQRDGPPPAILPSAERTGEAEPLPYVPPSPPRQPESGAPVGRTLMWAAVAILGVGALLLAYLIGSQGQNGNDDQPGNGSGSSPTRTATQPIEIVEVQDFDPPPGSGDENPDEVDLAIDGNASTFWETLRYDGDPKFGGLKEGVGLILDLGQAESVSRVVVRFATPGTSVELRAAAQDATTAPMDSAASYPTVGQIDNAGNEATFALDQPVTTRFLLVWVTELPSIGGDSYRAQVSEVEVAG